MLRRCVLSLLLSGSLISPFLIDSVSASNPDVKGAVKVDGSSTVYPIAEAVAEEFQKSYPHVNVTVGVAGTGGGFKKFLAGELDVVNASRPIKAAELETATKNGINFIEVPIAYDALSIVVNPKNTWVDKLTVKELATIWAPEAQGKVMKWSDVRAGFPDKPLQLFGPGTDSGTFDYFTESVVGKEDASRGDFTSSEDDNILVKGVEGNEGALGYFGVAYYEGNKDRLKVVPVDDEKDENGKGPQIPTSENVVKGSYQPLSRPLFIYVRKESLEKAEVKAFVTFFLENAKTLAPEVGYVPLPDSAYALAGHRVETRIAGSLFAGQTKRVGVTIEELLKSEQSK